MGLGGPSGRSSLTRGTREKTDQARACCCEPSSSSRFVGTTRAWAAALGTNKVGPLLLAEDVAPVGWVVVAAAKPPGRWRRRAVQGDRARLGAGSPHPHPRTARTAEVAVCLSRAQVPRGVCFPQPASLLLSWEQTQLSHEPADCQPHGWAWPTREELHSRALPETLTCEPNGLIFEASAFLGICHAALL